MGLRCCCADASIRFLLPGTSEMDRLRPALSCSSRLRAYTAKEKPTEGESASEWGLSSAGRNPPAGRWIVKVHLADVVSLLKLRQQLVHQVL